MRRWLALFLLVLLPFLSIWNVAAAYCGDESEARARHLGHHVDVRHADDASGSAGEQVAADPDCDHCHSPGAVQPLDLGCGAQLAAPTLPARWTEVTLRAPPLSLPERPKWVRLA